jgi:hypothetical protein
LTKHVRCGAIVWCGWESEREAKEHEMSYDVTALRGAPANGAAYGRSATQIIYDLSRAPGWWRSPRRRT